MVVLMSATTVWVVGAAAAVGGVTDVIALAWEHRSCGLA
jgi:uncharacterized membrane protein HdeD (DUF308 family)